MPIYDYECVICNNVEEIFQKISDTPPSVCVSCGAAGTLKRNVGGSSFYLKGGGWHKDLYGNTPKPDKK